jgi:hypothetical protein
VVDGKAPLEPVLNVPAEIVVEPADVLFPDKVSDPPVASIVIAPDPEIAPVNEADSAPLTVKLVLPTEEIVWIVLLPDVVLVPPEAMLLVPA